MDEATYYISVDYQDGDQSTYKGILLTINNLSSVKEETIRFNTSDISVDYIDLYKHLDTLNYNFISGVSSSSLDHFTSDGDKYKWLILSGRWEQIVPIHINTLEEMQNYYINKKGII